MIPCIKSETKELVISVLGLSFPVFSGDSWLRVMPLIIPSKALSMVFYPLY